MRISNFFNREWQMNQVRNEKLRRNNSKGSLISSHSGLQSKHQQVYQFLFITLTTHSHTINRVPQVPLPPQQIDSPSDCPPAPRAIPTC